MEDLAGFLYDSLRSKILPLADDIIIYPAHGAGSACGKNMARETSDTLGHQKETNYALRDISKEQFIHVVTEGLLPPPTYFPQNVRMNKEGYDNIVEVLERGCQPLSPEAFEAAANETGALILDTRDPQIFAKGFVPNSINIGIDGTFAPWVGALIPDVKQQLLIVADDGREKEVVTRLARVGYDYSIGYLNGGIDAWGKAGKEIDTITSMDAKDVADKVNEDSNAMILDVRKTNEYNTEHIKGAENIPLDFVNENMATLDKNKTYFVHCAGGYRSMIFSSILRARGYDNVIDINGGFSELKKIERIQVEQTSPHTQS
jgi:rhodanese-related sulfurtransferase